MSTHSKTSKAILVLLAFSLTTATVNAQEISFPNDQIVWLEGDNDPVEATFNGLASETDYHVRLSNQKFEGGFNEEMKTVSGSDSNVTTTDFSDIEKDISPGKYNLILDEDVNDEDTNDERTIYLREFNMDVESSGSGFVNERLGVDRTNTMILRIGLENDPKWLVEEGSFSSFSASGLSDFENGMEFIETGDKKNKHKLELKPLVDQDIGSTEMSFTFSVNGSSVEKSVDLEPYIYELRAIPVGERPSPLSDFKNIKRNFSYNLDMIRYGEDVGIDLGESDIESPLSNSADNHNFDLDIEPISDDGTDYDNEEKLLSVDDVSSDSEGDYRVELSQIPDLEPGIYEFTTELRYEKNGEIQDVFIDKIQVNKGLVLSGQVMDSQSRGIEMNMVLNEQGGANSIPVETDSSGYYNKEIPNPESEYDATLHFFDTVSSSRSYSDGRFTIEGIDFSSGENQDFAGDQQAIKFQYWQDPSVQLEAINPINMMAAKFGYPIDSEGHTASMKFNPANVDTDELQVYRCSQWNFLGRTCLGEWSEIEGDLSINYQSWRANFDIEEPYFAENAGNGGQNILMNAYIVGTSADLILNNGISVKGAGSQGRVETTGEVTVEGRVISENENFVEGAEVDVSFYEGSVEVQSFGTVETDAEGRFSVTGEAPSEPGNYTVQIEAEAENYDDLEQRFDDSLETFIAEGISLDVDSPLDVTLGEEVTTPVEVENTGQTEMENVELTFSGINSEFYSATDSSFSSIEVGDSRTVQLTFDFPTSYCGEVCEDYPAMDINVDAENSEGGEFEDSDSIQTQITAVSDESTSEQSADDPEETDNSGSFNAPDVAETTGEFLESQSSLNVALGLILVFLMVLAGAMKKKKEENDQRRGRNGSRPNVQRPNVQGQQNDTEDQESEDEVDDQIDEIADAFDEEESSQEEGSEDDVDEAIEEVGEAHEEADQEQEEESDSEDETFECDVCGEVFDSESGRKLHKKALH